MTSPTLTPTRPALMASYAVFTVFALVGIMFASWASRLPAIRDALGLTPGQLGLLLLVGSLGTLVALPLSGLLVHRIGTAATTRLGATVSMLGFATTAFAVYSGSPQLVGVLLFVTLMGVSACDVAMNLQGTVVERGLGRAIMPRFHAGFSLGSVAGAGVGALAAHAGIGVHWHLLLVALVGVSVIWAMAARYLPDGDVADHRKRGERERGAGARRVLRAWTEPRTLLIGVMVLAASLTEGAATDWVALATVDGFSATDAVGAAAFGLFVASMTVMRFAGTDLLDRFGRVAVLRVCAALALVGLLLFGLAGSLPLALIGVALWGLGAALGFPVGMSAASDDPQHSAGRVSVVSSIGYTAFLAGPPLLGLLADHIGLRHALLVIAIPLVASMLLAPVARPLPAASQRAATD